MSSIFLCVGQCGNQLADHLYKYIDLNETTQTSNIFKHNDGKFRSINIDSEIKVINTLQKSHNQKLRTENLIRTKCGRGSNWASGYNGLKKDGSLILVENSIESIRKEAEKCDYLLSFNMLHSLSGGTGSGCGSRLAQYIRDIYGWKKYLYTCSIAPFKNGELPLQHYNNLLCMSHLHDYADVITLFQNDDVYHLIEKFHHKTALTESAITLNEINSYINQCLISTLYPVDNISLKSQSIGMELYEMKNLLCSNINLKIVELFSLTEKTKSYFANKINTVSSGATVNPVIKEISSYIKKQRVDKVYSTINSIMILRGEDLTSHINLFQRAENEIKSILNCVKWNPYTVDYWTARKGLCSPSEGSKIKSKPVVPSPSVTLALNRNYCVDYLTEIRDKSMIKFNVKAYLHWYEKFEVDQSYFDHAFENIDFIIDSYAKMTV
jgi:hypothetical protein